MRLVAGPDQIHILRWRNRIVQQESLVWRDVRGYVIQGATLCDFAAM